MALDGYVEAKPTDATLGAALDLTCAISTLGDGPARTLLQRWAAAIPVAASAHQAFSSAQIEPFPPTLESVEFSPIGIASDWGNGGLGEQFVARFTRSLRHSGFPGELADGIAAAFGEMVDNVVQHSGDEELQPAAAVVGYHVEESWMSFAVADLGRGVLESLRGSSRWARVGSAAEGMRAVLEQRATRRSHEPEGHGFAQLLRALVNRNATLRFRTGDACLSFMGELRNPTFVHEQSAPMAGMQLAVIADLRQAPEERGAVAHVIT